MPGRSKIERPVSAGGVVYRLENQQVQILLCGQGDPSSWVLPKGTPDPGETMEETALREVQEETGLQVVIQSYVDEIRYWFSDDAENVLFHYLWLDDVELVGRFPILQKLYSPL